MSRQPGYPNACFDSLRCKDRAWLKRGRLGVYMRRSMSKNVSKSKRLTSGLSTLSAPKLLTVSLLATVTLNAQANTSFDSVAIPDGGAIANDGFIDQANASEVSGANNELATSSSQTYEHYRQLALQQQLSEHTSWRRLLYFNSEATHNDADKTSKIQRNPQNNNQNSNQSKSNRSLVDNPKFFITDNGNANPQAELDALLKLMLSTPVSTAERTARNTSLCRFPARIHWLKEQLAIADSAVAAIDCPEFDAWMRKLDPQKLSVIYAAEYLDNPLSAFGHTLMQIDSTKSLADPANIEYAHALNDTVAGNPDDNFLVYAGKSITGGYPNEITIDPLPEKLAYYLQGDERDVWRYPLELSQAEVQQIMRHVWETKDLGLPYYFTTDNCASEILRYIDVVRPDGDLLSQLPYVVVPSDVVRLLTKEGLITEQHYLPSDATLRQAKLNQAKRSLPNQNQAQDQNHSQGKSTQPIPTTIDSVITKDNALISVPINPASNNPNNAHPLKRVRLGFGQKHDLGYLDLGFRAGFNDLLDRPEGYPQHFYLEGLSTRVRVYDAAGNDNKPETAHQNHVELQELTLIRGRSFNPINSGKQGKTWGLNVGATRVNDGSKYNGDDHLVANVAYEQGVSMAFGAAPEGTGEVPPQLCYALGTGMGQLGKGMNKGWRLGVGVNVGCRYQFTPKLRAHAEVQMPYWYHGSVEQAQNEQAGQTASGHYWQPIANLGVQYDIDRTQAIRLQGSYEFQDRVGDQDDVQIAYVRYF